MKKSTFLKISGVAGVVFFAAQFMLLYFRTRTDSVLLQEASQRFSIQPIQLLVQTAYSLMIPVFILEPDILREVSSAYQPLQSCFPLCSSREVITFGVMEEDWIYQEQTATFRLLDKGMTLDRVTDYDPRQLEHFNPRSKITTHLFLWLAGSWPVIHLVMCYTRGEDPYHWVGPVPVQTIRRIPNLDLQKMTFGLNATAFPRLSLTSLLAGGHKWYVPDNNSRFLNHLQHSTFLECNHTRAGLFYTQHPTSNSSSNDQFIRKARQLLSLTKNILSELNVPFWLSSGTCLGWFRQCNIIPYSKDIDIGIRITDYKEDIIGAFEKNNFLLKHLFGKVSDSLELSFQAGDIKLDIFFFYSNENYTWNGGTQAKSGKKFIYKFPHFSICSAELLGLLLRVPCPTLPYIMANYGPDWFTPIQRWDWKSSPFNVWENGVWPRREWDNVIQVFAV